MNFELTLLVTLDATSKEHAQEIAEDIMKHLMEMAEVESVYQEVEVKEAS